MFRNAAITKAQLFHVFEGLSQLIVWLEGFLEGLYEIFVSPQLGSSVFASLLSSIFVWMNCCFQTAASPSAR
jgi:hypothetical protein